VKTKSEAEVEARNIVDKRVVGAALAGWIPAVGWDFKSVGMAYKAEAIGEASSNTSTRPVPCRISPRLPARATV
jgi:hypothetical protein